MASRRILKESGLQIPKRFISAGWGVKMLWGGTCWIQPLWLPNILMASASITNGMAVWLICSIKAKAVRLSVPSPGPIPNAWKASVPTGVVKMCSLASCWRTASGIVIWRMSLLHVGVWTVTFPAPVRKHACAAKAAEPAMPYLPAMSNALPNVPLCPKVGRGLRRDLI